MSAPRKQSCCLSLWPVGAKSLVTFRLQSCILWIWSSLLQVNERATESASSRLQPLKINLRMTPWWWFMGQSLMRKVASVNRLDTKNITHCTLRMKNTFLQKLERKSQLKGTLYLPLLHILNFISFQHQLEKRTMSYFCLYTNMGKREWGGNISYHETNVPCSGCFPKVCVRNRTGH